MSLRFRLVLVVLVLLSIGLAASDVATPTLLRSYLFRQVDDRLTSAGSFAAHLFAIGPVPAPSALPSRDRDAPRPNVLDVQAARINPAGRVVTSLLGAFSSSSDVFSHLPGDALARARRGETVRFEVAGRAGRYRARAEPIAGSRDVVVVISPLHDIEATLTRLYLIEGIATATLLLLAGGLALWLVRLGLRPLVHIADTADAVASGDVTRRVDVNGGYEVARLGRALNSAFDARAASEQTLREFIADASHELRTPLTSIRGYAELLRAGALQTPEDSARAVARIEHESARMGGLVDNLLSLARLDEGRPLVLAPVDLVALATDAVSDARAVEPDRPIALVAPRPVPVIGDETTLRQVFANLLANACQHTPEGAAVEVRVEATAAGSRLEVIDDGAGLDESAQGRVFDRFWRAAGSGNTSGEGSGLGLAIVAAVAAAHGGSARVTSNDGPLHGAHFVVDLPARPVA